MNIKTIAEAREGRVTVQIEAPTDFFDDRTTVTISVPAAAAEAYEVELKQQIAQQDSVMQADRQRMAELENQVNNLEVQLGTSRACAAAWDRDRHTERDRVDKAERAVRALTEEVNRRFTVKQMEDAKDAARADGRAEPELILAEIRGTVIGEELDQALRMVGQPLVEAVKNVRKIIYFKPA